MVLFRLLCPVSFSAPVSLLGALEAPAADGVFYLPVERRNNYDEYAMQETYIKAFQNAGSYTPMGKPMAWLLTITKNLALMKLRTESGRNEALDETLPSPGFEECTLDRLTLQTALNALSEEERQIVTLHAIAGMKHREIAGMLGLPLATVLSKYHRSLSKLKKLLKEEGHVDERDEHRAPLARARGAGDP